MVVNNFLFRIDTQKDKDRDKGNLFLLVIPEKYEPIILNTYHDSLLAGHQGLYRTAMTIRQKFFIHNLMNKVKRYIEVCHMCLKTKPKYMKNRRKTILEKAETEAEVVDLISSDKEMEDVSRISTTAVKQEEEEGDDSDEDDSDDDAKCTDESSEESSDDKLGIKDLKEIYEEHSVGETEQQMDTTEETKGAEGMEQTLKTGSTSRSIIKVKSLEKPRVSTAIPQYEPPVMRCRSSMMLEKTLSERLLEQFEKLEAEELQEAKGIAEMARMTPKLKMRGKPKKTPPAKVPKVLDLEQMETGDIEGPASGQITPGEASVISDMYTADMSMEEINLRNVLLEPKKWKLDSLDEIYSMLDHYCEL